MIDQKPIGQYIAILRNLHDRGHRITLASDILDYILIVLPTYANDKASVNYLLASAREVHAIVKEADADRN